MGKLIYKYFRCLGLSISILAVSTSTVLANGHRINWQQSVDEKPIHASIQRKLSSLSEDERSQTISRTNPWKPIAWDDRIESWMSVPYLAEKSKEKKKEIEERREKFESLPPDEKNKIREKYEWFHNLSPEEQKEVRKKWKQDRGK